MLTELEIRPVTNPYVMRLFARGKILSEADQIEQIRSMLFNALAEFSRQSSDWRLALEYVNRILIKNRYKMRIYPAGLIPLFQYPVAVVFKITGEYCLLFELAGLANETRVLEFPIEANMSNAFFMDLLTDIILKNREVGSSGMVYTLLTRLFKIPGLHSYGVTLRQNPDLLGHDILVIAENPFGMEFRMSLKPFQDKDLQMNVKCTIDRETKKKIKNIPDVFFIWEMLQDIAKAWPADRSAAELVKVVGVALDALTIRSITKRYWRVDRRVSKDCLPIGWLIEETAWDSREQPGSISLPLISEADDTIRFVVSFKGLTEEAAKGIESVYNKKESLSDSLKNIFTLKRKTDDIDLTACMMPVSFNKAPRELSRAVLKCIQRNLNISYAELKHAIQIEMKRNKLESKFAVDQLCMELAQTGPAFYVTEIETDQTYKFILERRTDETTGNVGLVQVDESDEEIRRFSIAKSRISIKQNSYPGRNTPEKIDGLSLKTEED